MILGALRAVLHTEEWASAVDAGGRPLVEERKFSGCLFDRCAHSGWLEFLATPPGHTKGPEIDDARVLDARFWRAELIHVFGENGAPLLVYEVLMTCFDRPRIAIHQPDHVQTMPHEVPHAA